MANTLKVKQMKHIFLFSLLLFFSPFFAQAQGAAYSIKGGPSIGMQKWDSQIGRRNPLLSYHIIAAVEEVTEDNRHTIFAQLGYHARGTSLKTTFLNTNGSRFDQDLKIQFNNIALSLGAKKRFGNSDRMIPYYLLGVRGEYTVSNNLNDLQKYNDCFPIYPIDNKQFIKKFNYGAIFGGGFEFPFSELYGGFVEFTINPDFSRQYEQPAFSVSAASCSFGSTEPRTVPQRRIKNLTFEISVGFKFLNKVEYID